jgi:hypothetical protein
MYHYDPLKSYLASKADDIVAMSYKDVENILGRALPPSARGDSGRQWWANTESHSQAKAWLAAGRRAKPDVRSETVNFVRDRAPGNAQAEPILLDRQNLNAAAMRMLNDVAEEHGISFEAAAIALLNQAALARRKRTLAWFAEHTIASSTSSADLIRADRDAH